MLYFRDRGYICHRYGTQVGSGTVIANLRRCFCAGDDRLACGMGDAESQAGLRHGLVRIIIKEGFELFQLSEITFKFFRR